MRFTGYILGILALAGLAAPSFASAQTYYPYQQQYGGYPYQQQYYYGQGYYPYNQYPSNQYYYGTPSCSINYRYINNGYWYNGTYHQPVQLTWTSSGAYSAYISNIGTVAQSGSQVVYPSSSANTTYTMTVQGPGGSNTCYTSVSLPNYQYQNPNYYYQQYPYYQQYYNQQYYYPYGNQYYYNGGSTCYTYPYACY